MGCIQSREDQMVSAIAQEPPNMRMVKACQAKGLKPFSKLNAAGDTVAMLAVRLEKVEVLQHLLDESGKKASFMRGNNAGLTPLHEAARLADVKMLKMLLAVVKPELVDVSDALGRTPLHHAAALDLPDSVHALAAAGADLDAHTKPPASRTPLHVCAYSGCLDAAQALLEAGALADVQDGKGDTPAHDAAGRRHTAVLQLLIGAGVNMQVTNKEGATVAELARTDEALAVIRSPMLVALESENAADEAEKLVRCGHSPNSATGLLGRTPLHSACSRNDAVSVQTLLAAGALPNLRDRDGNTALHYAAGFGSEACVKLLLAAGAKIELVNKAGLAPYEVVTIPHFPEEAEGEAERMRPLDVKPA